jgi:hypothetical protein
VAVDANTVLKTSANRYYKSGFSVGPSTIEPTHTSGTVVDANGNTFTYLGNTAPTFKFVAEVVKQTSVYTTSNVAADRTFDANAITTDELADVVGTLIADLKLAGILT